MKHTKATRRLLTFIVGAALVACGGGGGGGTGDPPPSELSEQALINKGRRQAGKSFRSVIQMRQEHIKGRTVIDRSGQVKALTEF